MILYNGLNLLKTKEFNQDDENDDHDNDYEIEDYSSSDSSHSDHDHDNDDKTQMNWNSNELILQQTTVDYKKVKSVLVTTGFMAKRDFLILLKPFQFERFGFKNKKDQKLLFEKTKQLIQKYPKIKSKKSKKTQGYIESQKKGEFRSEGFVQDTN